MNTIGSSFRITIFGSSHGPVVGCTIDGCPPGVRLEEAMLEEHLSLRRPIPGIGTPRREVDQLEILSGVKEGLTTGAPITITIANRDVDSSKYLRFRGVPRPGHADYPALIKYGEHHDISGGGQFSGRMTAALVSGGSVARSLLSSIGVRVGAYTRSIGELVDEETHDLSRILEERGRNPVRAASPELAERMRGVILDAGREEDSVGGVVECHCDRLPAGVGEPFFDTVEGELSKMMFSIPGVRGVEFGSGFQAARMRGSEHNDPFSLLEGRVMTVTNHHGGVLGGMTSGMPLVMRVAFKPTASIGRPQRSVDLNGGKEEELIIEGRHDPCIVPRAVIVVESCLAMVMADLCMRGGLLG
jgi:chorismate synthase